MVSTLLTQGVKMENQDEINQLVNSAKNYVEDALNLIEKAESLSISSRYTYDLLRQAFSHLAMTRHHLNVANDITERISV